MPLSFGSAAGEDIFIAIEGLGQARMIENDGSSVQGNDYTVGILMKGLCLTNRIADGFKLLQIMKSSSMKPNDVVYNTLLHALCKNGEIGRARSLMNEIKDGYCKEDNLVQSLMLLEKSFSLGFVPDVVTLMKVVEILCRAARVESKRGVVDVVAYNTLIKGFCRLGNVKVWHRFLKEMERKGCLPNVDTYNILISGFCESGIWILNFDTCDTLIEGLRSYNGWKSLKVVLEVVLVMIVCYVVCTRKICEMRHLSDLEKLFPRAMSNESGIANVLVYDCLIHGFCHEGFCRKHLRKEGSALKLLGDMVGRGCLPDVGNYSPLIDTFLGRLLSQGFKSVLANGRKQVFSSGYLTWNSWLLFSSSVCFVENIYKKYFFMKNFF
ncbi:hypothetical protein P3X46_029073 [Hevea brasiliensis]|uniref:Pentatricopeptide repeat-containing protein n=1 Tax=Hevea brasiliensis TaxID=3981 RepID=A0ABQ9KSZ7_HEVBR|nr:hypothetical protein P3X46_029073 [Hevea brasiliensis]